jgi:hydroxymethylpyrimidine pyrophosphatase-like HAD family hydrolase
MLLLNESLVIDIVFRWINFILFLLVLGYFFKKYIVKRVKGALVAQQEQRDKLIQGTQINRSMMERVLYEKQQQEMVYHVLHQRMMAWQKTVADDQERRVLAYRSLLAQLEQKRKLQRENISRARVKDMIIPEIVEQVESRVKSRFLTTDEGEKYTQRIVMLLKETT